ncbi:hypothetical protein [Priestia aryabhattai]
MTKIETVLKNFLNETKLLFPEIQDWDESYDTEDEMFSLDQITDEEFSVGITIEYGHYSEFVYCSISNANSKDTHIIHKLVVFLVNNDINTIIKLATSNNNSRYSKEIRIPTTEEKKKTLTEKIEHNRIQSLDSATDFFEEQIENLEKGIKIFDESLL